MINISILLVKSLHVNPSIYNIPNFDISRMLIKLGQWGELRLAREMENAARRIREMTAEGGFGRSVPGHASPAIYINRKNSPIRGEEVTVT